MRESISLRGNSGRSPGRSWRAGNGIRTNRRTNNEWQGDREPDYGGADFHPLFGGRGDHPGSPGAIGDPEECRQAKRPGTGHVREIALIPIVLIIAAIAIPNLLRAKMAANEASSVGSLRTYSMAITSYAEECPNQGYPASTVNLGPGAGNCDGANLVDRALAGPMPSKSGYVFHYEPGAPDAAGKVMSYTITADPIQENTTGIRHFFLDESGVIRTESGRAASVESKPLR
jgi:type IV pilus assembly protein PilA